MNFELDFTVLLDEESIDSASLLSNLPTYRDKLTDVGDLEGIIVARVDNEELKGDVGDPLLRLADQWVRKLPWVLGGDTETLPLRNSEYCFAFVPAGDSVEYSFFSGSEAEIEEYVFEPFNVRLELFASATIRLCEKILQLVEQIDPALMESLEDVRDFKASLDEARAAWREHKALQRR